MAELVEERRKRQLRYYHRNKERLNQERLNRYYKQRNLLDSE